MADEVEQTEVEDLEAKVRAEFNQHVKDLVGLFVQEYVQGLQQQIDDLTRVLVEGDAAQFVPHPLAEHQKVVNEPSVPEYVPGHRQADSSGVRWYQPGR